MAKCINVNVLNSYIYIYIYEFIYKKQISNIPMNSAAILKPQLQAYRIVEFILVYDVS